MNIQWDFESASGQHHLSDEKRGTLAVVWERPADRYRPGACHVLVAGWQEATTEPNDLTAAKEKAERAVRKIHPGL